MSGPCDSPRSEDTEKQIVLLELNPTFGGGRIVVFHLDRLGNMSEVGRFMSGEGLGQQPPDISDTIRSEIAQGNKRFVIELSQARWLNSRGIGYLTKLWASITRSGGDVILTNVSHRLMALLKVTKLDQIFDFCDSVEAARERLESGGD
jgi:anti-sigma B factor antagonist